MVKTELSYNPYLLETIVRFNGQEPRINSLIEKYQDGKLQKWIEKLPQIFHDEMNGYGFELIYSGVEADYKRIIEAFKRAGVSEDEVEFFYKNELEDPITKNTRFDELLSWLENNRNRRFDYEEFKLQNRELLDTPYSFVAINGSNVDTVTLAEEVVNVEKVDDVGELSSTDLTDTPIVLFVDANDTIQNRKNLELLISREDVLDEQLFFFISPLLKKSQIKRTIIDLGIRNPKIVDGLSDSQIVEYFEIYPLTNYIKKMIDIFRVEVDSIKRVLDEETEASSIKNLEIHTRIDSLENDIQNLKQSDDMFVQRDNIDLPDSLDDEVKNLQEQIISWRKKKTKTTSREEAEKMAAEFDAELERYFIAFRDNIIKVTNDKKNEIDVELKSWYERAGVDTSYIAREEFNYAICDYSLPKLYGGFLELKTEQMVDAKSDFLGFFRNTDKEQKEQVLEITYTYETWRSKANCFYQPIACELSNDRKNALEEYYNKVSQNYHEHIERLISEKTEQKNRTAEQLSGEEKLLQDDNDWLSELSDKLHLIERG